MRKIQFEKAKTSLYEEVTKDGLKVIVAPIEGAQKSICGIYVNYGGFKHEKTIGKTNIPYGVAHFIEHRLFDTPKGNASVLMEELGAYSNAYTSHSFTVYYFETTEDIYKPLDILLAMTTNMGFTEEAVENEKDIIIAELSEYEDDRNDAILRELKHNLYFESPLKQDILGTRTSIKETHLSTLKKVFYNNYKLDNLTLICAGKVNPEEISSYLSKVKFTQRQKSEQVTELEYKENYSVPVKERSEVVFNLETTTVGLGIKFPPRRELYEKYGDKMFAIYEILPNVLFSQIRNNIEKMKKDNLIISNLGANIIEGGEDTMLYALFTTDKPNELINELKDYLSKLPSTLKSGEFRAIRNNYVGSMLRSFGDVNDYFDELVEKYANHIAAPAMIESVKMLSKHTVKDFLNDLKSWPITFTTFKKD